MSHSYETLCITTSRLLMTDEFDFRNKKELKDTDDNV